MEIDKETNDALRAKIPYIVPPNILVITRGIATLVPKAVADILLKVKEFNDFNEDNDPWSEHDFGSLSGSGVVSGFGGCFTSSLLVGDGDGSEHKETG